MKTAPEPLSDRDFLAVVIAEAMYDAWQDGVSFGHGRWRARMDLNDLQSRAREWVDRFYEGKAA